MRSVSGITIVTRLAALTGVALVATALVAGTAFWGARDQRRAAGEMAVISDGMSRQWNADMMHDGLRADVMAAMYARSAEQRAAYGVAEVAEHADALLDNYDAAAAAA